MKPTRMGSQKREAAILSSRYRMRALMKASRMAAMMPPSTGEMTQLAAMPPMLDQWMESEPAAMMPAPTTPPTTAWVVETGAPM